MNATSPDHLQLAHHTLYIADPDISLAFYQEKLGMTLLARRVDGGKAHYFLGYVEPGKEAVQQPVNLTQWQALCFLELVHDANGPVVDVRKQPDQSEGYWKIAICVKDVDIARNSLMANNVAVDTPRQMPDVAYLCHFNDPDGYCIELIQHDFLHNHSPEPEVHGYRLRTPPTFSLITYRVKDAERSIKFYCDLLGMRLLSRQVIEAKGFTLYFLACTAETPPNKDIEAVDNREWLWKRPYTMLEFQHIWGSESKQDFAYRVGSESGFQGVSFGAKKLQDLLQKIAQTDYKVVTCASDPILQVKTATVSDPDGYSIRLIDKG